MFLKIALRPVRPLSNRLAALERIELRGSTRLSSDIHSPAGAQGVEQVTGCQDQAGGVHRSILLLLREADKLTSARQRARATRALPTPRSLLDYSRQLRLPAIRSLRASTLADLARRRKRSSAL
jgi:hypothetical protein